MATIKDDEAAQDHHDNLAEATKNAPETTDVAQPDHNNNLAVRFKSAVEEIAPAKVTTTQSSIPEADDVPLGDPGEVTPEQIKALSKSLQICPLQEKRMNIFSYEPCSLPASRTVSNEDDSRAASRLNHRGSDVNTPPLTPAGTGSVEGERKHSLQGADRDERGRQPNIITPQESSQESTGPARPAQLSSTSSDHLSPRQSASDDKEHDARGDHRKGLFAVGGSSRGSPAGSQPASRESSPSRAAASQFYTRPLTPAGDANDPYAASKRQPQSKIESRFVFSRKPKATSPSSSTISLPRTSQDKRHSGIFGHVAEETAASSRQGSMSDLKRFLKLGAHSKAKRAASPAPSIRPGKAGTKTPPSNRSSIQIPFADDHGLTSKYGKLGKVLGAGAGGSVRLMKRPEDGVVFAVKEFRPRHSYESEREYTKKLTAEYCMGSSLHHSSIIETLDIVQEKGKWFEVMEYAPFDLFAIVMTGKMSREEISCCFLQILSGVTYLHSMGLAHRDLKLDNVVVSEHGIMKIIDFGSAHVFKYPFESNIVLATGIVGSDPYLAPEVYDERKYDPQAVDIWSLAIIYCCMTLRRFPWKVPRLTDSSYKLFAAEPTPGHDPKKLILPPSRSTASLGDIPMRDMEAESVTEKKSEKSEKSEHEETKPQADAAGEKKEVVRGPWRILRLLPRESRHVIGRMLEIDPKERAKMDEILENPWVANTVICRQDESGEIENAEDHTHVLEPPAAIKQG